MGRHVDVEETVGSSAYSMGRRSLLLAAGVGVALALTGCGAGQITQTASQVAAVNGAQGNVGMIAVRDAQLSFPTNPEHYYRSGEDAPLELTIANSGVPDDELRSVRSDQASNVQITGSQKIPGGFALRAEPEVSIEQPSEAAPPESGAAESSAAEPSSGAQESTAPGTSESTKPAPSSAAAVPAVAGEVSITLSGLKQDVRPGQLVTVTFTFAKAGEVTMKLPIAEPPAGTDAE